MFNKEVLNKYSLNGATTQKKATVQRPTIWVTIAEGENSRFSFAAKRCYQNVPGALGCASEYDMRQGGKKNVKYEVPRNTMFYREQKRGHTRPMCGDYEKSFSSS